jgi:predicted  nucleic acid-binding Zn-ribbon protein
MSAELQKANDMLAAIQSQRDQAMNGLVLAQAEIAALRRQIAEGEQKLKALHETNAEIQAQRDQALNDVSRLSTLPAAA